MDWLKKKSDPVSDRAKALTSEIAALEAQIKRLDEQCQHPPASPRLRSTAVPHGGTIQHPHIETDSVSEAMLAAQTEPVFEQISPERITTQNEMPNAREHFNEFGIRKYDFPALVQRVKAFFTGPNTSNPRLVNYLAAGGVHGLRPLRKEKRVARNRFVFFSTLLFLGMLGILYWYFRNR
jgi:cell division protein FtsB